MNEKKLEAVLSNIYDAGRFDQEHGSFLKDTVIENAITDIEAGERENQNKVNFNESDDDRAKWR